MPPPRRSGLGRGLSALIPSGDVAEAQLEEVPLAQIRPNPYQPRKEFDEEEWKKVRINVKTEVLLEDGSILTHKGYREMDFVKNKLGVEVQFGKYAFMVYNVSAKMTIFHQQGIIDAGVEIVPMKSMQKKMSTGVSFFEQFKTDLEMRGVADIDIPVLIVGIVQ